MLTITVPASEQYDESTNEFVYSKEQTLQLEHSLVSLSKWESKWCKPFLTNDPKTDEESMDYIRCMTLTKNVDPDVYRVLSRDNMDKVNRYIAAPMTATTVREEKGSKSHREQITSELIYYWMIALNIPFECEKWHLNRLLMLVRVCNAKNQPPKKTSQRELMSRNAALNEANRKRFNSKG